MMTNYTILQRNILDSLAHEEAKAIFLRACDQPNDDIYHYWAEQIARRSDKLCGVLKPAILAASNPFGDAANNEVRSGLLDFMLKRFWHLQVGAV